MKAVVSKNLYDFHLDLQDEAPQCYLLAYQSRSLTLTQIRRGHTRITLANKMEGLVLTGFHLEVLSFVYWALELHGHPRKKETGEDQASRERVSEFGWCTKELLGMDTGWLEVDLSKQTTEVEPLQCPELVTWFLAVGVKQKGISGKIVFSGWFWILMGFVSPEPISETILYLCTERKHCSGPERGLISPCP